MRSRETFCVQKGRSRKRRFALLRRKEQIVTYADEGIAFWDGQSRGRAHALACVRREGKPLRIFPF